MRTAAARARRAPSTRRRLGGTSQRRSSRWTSASSSEARSIGRGRSRRIARASSNEAFRILTLGVLGRLELALGNLEAAGGYLRDLPGRLLAGGMNDPTPPVWADAIETLVALGELEQARAYLEQYELNARRLGSPLAMEGVLRCRGLLCAAEGDLPAALAAFERALTRSPTRPGLSSAPAPCSAWAPCAGRRSRRRRPGRRSSRRWASSRSWAPTLGGESSGRAKADQRPPPGSRMG